MYPYYHIGPLTMPTYGLCMFVGVIISSWLLFHQARRNGQDGQTLYYIFVSSLLVGILAGKIYRFLFESDHWDPFSLLRFWTDHSFYGMAIGFVSTWAILTRKNNIQTIKSLNTIVPAILSAQIMGRLGCFFVGCCYGKPTDSWIGVQFQNVFGYRHPTQLYEMAAAILIMIAISILQRRRLYTDKTFFIYIYTYAGARLIIENFRGDNPHIWPGLTFTQIVSILILLSLPMVVINFKKRASTHLTTN